MKTQPVYPALAAIRDVTSHPVPVGAQRGACSICKQRIEETADAVVFQETESGPSYIAHQACQAEQMTRIVAAFGRFGGGRMARALRGRR